MKSEIISTISGTFVRTTKTTAKSFFECGYRIAVTPTKTPIDYFMFSPNINIIVNTKSIDFADYVNQISKETNKKSFKYYVIM